MSEQDNSIESILQRFDESGLIRYGILEGTAAELMRDLLRLAHNAGCIETLKRLEREDLADTNNDPS